MQHRVTSLGRAAAPWAAAAATAALALAALAPARVDDQPAAPGAERRNAVVRAVERVGPAVVNISTERLVRNPYYGGTLHEWLFGQPAPRARERYVTNSLGSGVIVDPRGYVVTNEHVIVAASRITVTFVDGRQVPAELVGSASEYDLALLELTEPGPYPFVPVDFAGPLYPGETVVAIGNPFGLESTVTTGVLSGTHRRMESGGERYTDFLQTDAAINPGNSGGALLTVNGELIGINTQIDARGQNLGFAIPVARVRKVFDELARHGQVLAVFPGMVLESLDALEPDVAKSLGVPGGRGLLVRRVHAGCAAARATITPGDVLLSVDGERVREQAELRTVLSRIQVGRTVPVEVWRDGATLALRMEAEALPRERAPDLLWQHLGLRVQDVRGRGNATMVMVGDVRAGSRAHEIGFKPGLVVLGLDGERIQTADELFRQLASTLDRRSVVLTVADGEALYRVPLPVE